MPNIHRQAMVHMLYTLVCGRRSLLARVRVDLDLAVIHGPRGGPKCVRVPE